MRNTLIFLLAVTVSTSCGDDEPNADDAAASAGSGTSTSTTASAATTGSGGSGGSAATTGAGGNAGTDTWANFAEQWFTDFCAGCHPGNGQPRDYTIYANVVTDANDIRCGSAPVGSMLPNCQTAPRPPGWFPVGNGAMPTDMERIRLVAWIDNGMPQ